MAQYDFLQSLHRIDNLLGFKATGNPLPYIPKYEEIKEDATLAVNATIMFIKIDINNESQRVSSKQKELALQILISEMSRICRGNENCRDFVAASSYVFVVYSTPKKVDVDTVIDDSARIRSLSMVVEKKCQGVKINTSLGIDYGQILMTATLLKDGNIDFSWSGNPIETSKKIVEESANNVVSISTIIWNNIRIENQRLFKSESIPNDYYSGNIINVLMNNWVLQD